LIAAQVGKQYIASLLCRVLASTIEAERAAALRQQFPARSKSLEHEVMRRSKQPAATSLKNYRLSLGQKHKLEHLAAATAH
jgi:hypothetical protein